MSDIYIGSDFSKDGVTPIERLMAWRAADPFRWWSIMQDCQAYTTVRGETDRASDVCVGLTIMRATKTGKRAGIRLMGDRWYNGFGATIDEAIIAALAAAKEGGDD